MRFNFPRRMAGLAFLVLALSAATRVQALDELASPPIFQGEIRAFKTDAFSGFRERYPHAGEKIMANLARLLAKRLIVANHKIEVLASY